MEITATPQFVGKVVAVSAQPQQRQEIQNPTWDQVEGMLRELAGGTFSRIDLFNNDESCAMTVYGQATAFFIVICIEESTYYYFWNGQKSGGEEQEIAGHLFDAEKVCQDFETLAEIAKEFWRTGDRLQSVRWLSETLES